jgi:RHS repeat-associated protein
LDSAFNSLGKKDSLVALHSGLGHLVRSTYSDSGNAFFPPPSGTPGRYSSVERFRYDGLSNLRADTLTYTGRTNWATETYAGSRTRTYEAGTGRLKTIVANGLDVDSLFYDAAGNVVFSTRQAFPTQAGTPPVEDRAQYYDAAERLLAVDHRLSNAFVATGQAVYPIVFEFEEFRYDALGRRVMDRARRSCNPLGLQDDACGLSYISRVVWDGSQQAIEIRQPGDSAATAAVLENDTAPAQGRPVYQGTNGEFVDPNAFFGRVVYTHGVSLDAPLSITRWEYADSASLQIGVPNGYQRWTEPFTIVPHWTSRGSPDNGTFNDGLKTFCGAGGVASRCVKVAWPFGFSAYKQKTFRSISWHGSLIEDNRDASGLLYRRNRYVDPNTGQFTQEDPIGLAGGMNLYGFAGSNPVSYGDPFGLCPPRTMAEVLICIGQLLRPAQRPLEIAGTLATLPLGGSMGMMEEAGAGALAFGVASRTAGTAARVGNTADHVVLGLASEGLEATAARVGGRTLMNDAAWRTSVMKAVADPNTKLTVSLDGLSGSSTYLKVMNAVQRGAANSGNTNWELYQIYQAGRLRSVQFVERGGTRILANPF